MHFLFLLALAAANMDGLATISQYLFTIGLCTSIVMTLAYLWYTIGTARLAKQLAQAKQQSNTAANTKKTTIQAQLSEGGVATLTRSDIVLHEQPDGENPIPLNLSLITIGRIGTTLGWLTVL